MTVLRSLKRRGHNPLAALTHAVSHYAANGELPPLPTSVAADR
jgi:transposase